MFIRLAVSFFAAATFAFDLAAQEAPAQAKGASADIVVAGQILKEDARDKIRNSPSKVHALRLEKDQAYAIEVVGEGIVPFVHLEDSAGNPLGQGVNRVNNISRLRFTASKDEIFLFYVVSQTGNEGKYTLSVKLFVPAAVKLIPLTTPAANKPTEIEGKLNDDDPPCQRQEFPGKVYGIEFKAGKTYVIDLMSKQFDVYLLLEDANAVLIAQDDDSGGNLNSRLRFVAPANGRFRIVATTFNGQGGPYTLRVAEQP